MNTLGVKPGRREDAPERQAEPAGEETQGPASKSEYSGQGPANQPEYSGQGSAIQNIQVRDQQFNQNIQVRDQQIRIFRSGTSKSTRILR